MVKQKRTVQAMTDEMVEARIRDLDIKGLEKMGLDEFCLLRQRTNNEGRRRLSYLMGQADLEYKIRKIVCEELAKANLEKDAAREERVTTTFKRIDAELKAADRQRRGRKKAKR
jgi:hypothetical protein